MTAVMRSGSEARQITVWQPAAVAMRAAVSLVAIPPVPHWVPAVLVSTCRETNDARDQRTGEKGLNPPESNSDTWGLERSRAGAMAQVQIPLGPQPQSVGARYLAPLPLRRALGSGPVMLRA